MIKDSLGIDTTPKALYWDLRYQGYSHDEAFSLVEDRIRDFYDRDNTRVHDRRCLTDRELSIAQQRQYRKMYRKKGV